MKRKKSPVKQDDAEWKAACDAIDKAAAKTKLRGNGQADRNQAWRTHEAERRLFGSEEDQW